MSILRKPSTCQGCALEQLGGGFMIPEGKGLNKVLVTSDFLGTNEKNDGLPLRPKGRAGSVFERALRRLGLSRDQFLVSSQIYCQPPGNKLVGMPYERPALDHCQVHFEKLIPLYNPKVILALGDIPTQNLTGLCGDKLSANSIRGYALDSCDELRMNLNTKYPGIIVVPTQDPSLIAFGMNHLMGVFMRDISFAVKIARDGGIGRPKPDFVYIPPREFAESFYQECLLRPNSFINHDVETDRSLATEDESDLSAADPTSSISNRITQIQFTLEGYPTTIVLPWEGWCIDFAKKILLLPNPKSSWNGWGFDNKRYQDHDVQLNGPDHDLMWAWHHVQPDLPRGLLFATSFYVPGALPWKHLSGTDKGFYGWCDTQYLEYDRLGIFRDLQQKGLRNCYDRQVVETHRLLVNVSKRGIPQDPQRREEFGKWLNEQCGVLLKKMDEIVPDELKNVSPKNGYVKTPQDTTGLIQREFEDELNVYKPCPDCVGKGVLVEVSKVQKGGEVRKDILECSCKTNGVPKADCLECFGEGIVESIYRVKVKEIKCKKCKGKGVLVKGKQLGKVVRWCNLIPFKPSKDQLIRYMKFKHHPIPTKIDDDEKETTGKSEIEKLYKKTKDPLYKVELEYKEIDKLRGTYYEGWKPKNCKCFWQDDQLIICSQCLKDPNVHADFSFSPATGQLAATDPNVLTGPKRGQYAKKFRFTIMAPRHPEQRVLVERDWTAAHALTLGFEAQDPLYMNVARNDIHGFVTMFSFKKPECNRLLDLAVHPSPDAAKEMKAIIKHYRKTDEQFEFARNFKSKPAILGIGFKMGVAKLYKMNTETYSSQREAQGFKDLLKGIFPKIFQFQDDICLACQNGSVGKNNRPPNDPGFLKSRFNYIRYFWDIYHYDYKRNEMVSGEDQEACVAFLPANDAFGLMKEACLRTEDPGYNEKFSLINIIHDAQLWMPKYKDLEECLFISQQEMERPSPFLIDPVVAPKGLQIFSEAQVGLDWSTMQDFETFKTDSKVLNQLNINLSSLTPPLPNVTVTKGLSI